jgi:hypothetical protein
MSEEMLKSAVNIEKESQYWNLPRSTDFHVIRSEESSTDKKGIMICIALLTKMAEYGRLL